MSAGIQYELAGPEKDLFRIGEVSRLTGTKQFVLRYWETEFPMLKPVKSPKGHRLYRREDVDTVLRIKRLLYDEGFTIAGARRHLLENGNAALDEPVISQGDDGGELASSKEAARGVAEQYAVLDRQTLLELREALRSFLTLLESE